MPKQPQEYVFKIEGHSIEALPMKRLAEYMGQLAALLGEPEQVHFLGLRAGSVGLAHCVEPAAVQSVQHRLKLVQHGGAPADTQRAWNRLDELLTQDQASAALMDARNRAILTFPGAAAPAGVTFGPFNQSGTLDGVPIRVGGENDPVPVHLEEPGQPVHICLAPRAIAREIAPYIFGATLRCEGTGRWHRTPQGEWVMDKFTITGFTVLQDTTLPASVAALRKLHAGSGNAAAAILDLQQIRSGRATKG